MIREYSKGENSSGFIGIRVAVTINKGLHQKYFSFFKDGHRLPDEEIQKLREEAKELEASWKKEADRFKELSFLNRKSKSELVIAPNLRLYVKATKRRGKLYVNPAFITQATKNHTTVNSVKTFGSNRSAKQAFSEVLEDYQLIHNLTDKQKEELMEKAKQFRKKKKYWLEAVNRIRDITPELIRKVSESFDEGYNNWN